MVGARRRPARGMQATARPPAPGARDPAPAPSPSAPGARTRALAGARWEERGPRAPEERRVPCAARRRASRPLQASASLKPRLLRFDGTERRPHAGRRMCAEHLRGAAPRGLRGGGEGGGGGAGSDRARCRSRGGDEPHGDHLRRRAGGGARRGVPADGRGARAHRHERAPGGALAHRCGRCRAVRAGFGGHDGRVRRARAAPRRARRARARDSGLSL